MSKETRTNIICIAVFVIIAAVSFFGVGKWATSIETYSNTTETLGELKNQAMEMTTGATVLGMAAAAVPTETLTPLANKLMDVAGYMVIVYVAITLEKYLLTLTGFAAFKILIPAGCLLAILGRLLRKETGKVVANKLAMKCVLMGLLLWVLVPVSAAATNLINATYQESYDSAMQADGEALSEDKVETEENMEDNEKDTEAETEDSSVLGWIKEKYNTVAGVVEESIEKAGETLSEKKEYYEKQLNYMIEHVAIMIVTTCAIPICVLLLFIWIIKMITGININIPSNMSLPRISKQITEKDSGQCS